MQQQSDSKTTTQHYRSGIEVIISGGINKPAFDKDE